MSLTFLTGNQHKFEEASAIIPDLEMLSVDLPEIQSIDAKEVIEAKLQEAKKQYQGPLVVEDTGLYLNCMNGFPGPLIKWMLQAIGHEELAQIARLKGETSAIAKTVLGYWDGKDFIHYFDGIVEGQVVHPRAESSFGWDPIFLPDGEEKTFAEMTKEQKNATSMRSRAFSKLKDFLG